jgi:hypothetical protein
MASLVKHKGSPFWYVAHRDRGGKRKHSPTKFYHDKAIWLKASKKGKGNSNFQDRWPEQRRKAKALCLKATATEAVTATDGNALWAKWVPQFLNRRYVNQLTLNKYTRLWVDMEVLLGDLGYYTPDQLGPREWDRLVDAVLEEWSRWRRMSIQKGPISLMKVLMAEAFRLEYSSRNPTVGFNVPGIEKYPKRMMNQFTDRELNMVWDALKERPMWMTVSFVLGLYHGSRISATRIEPWQVEDKIIHFLEKGGVRHSVPISPLAQPFLTKVRLHGNALGVSRNSMSPMFSSLFKKLKMPHVFHDTRVTCVTRMALSGVPQQLAQAYVNHSSSLIHRIYVRVNPDQLKAIHQPLEAAYGGRHCLPESQGCCPEIPQVVET